MSSVPVFRPRSATEVLDAAFQFLRAGYVPLVATALVLLAPITVLGMLAETEGQVLLANWISNAFYAFATAGTVVLVSDGYHGRGLSVGRALKVVGARWGHLLVAAVIQLLVVGVGAIPFGIGAAIALPLFAGAPLLALLVCIPFLIPVAILAAWAFAMPVVVMLEGVEGTQAFERSMNLAKGEVKRILLTLGLTYVIFFAVVIGTGLLMAYLPASLGTLSENLNALVGIALYPFVGVTTTILYYDLRIRKEAFDVEQIMEGLGEVDPVPAPAALPAADPAPRPAHDPGGLWG